ncbi:ERF008 protein [Hibiscus syriacus]|uniref:ERF008 protein n=1 Tax=Hibiscus syriacus TaxID=106335 RepID=A0A6A3AGQ3_HIBSY|nr:ERF008 protein [Hibiscus syriacus]
MERPLLLQGSSRKSTAERPYKGIRMRSGGNGWLRLGSPTSAPGFGWVLTPPVAAARAYDTAVFYLRGPSARLNFPDLLSGEKFGGGDGDLSASSIRKKAVEVGARVDALEAAHHHRHNYNHGYEEELKPSTGGFLHRVDLNKMPDPEDSDTEWGREQKRGKGSCLNHGPPTSMITKL